MKLKILMLSLLSILLTTKALCTETTAWKTWTDDPKGHRYRIEPRLKRQPTVTENLEENILQLHGNWRWNKQENEKQGKGLKLDLKIKSIGKWHNFEVFDVYGYEIKTKTIIVKASDNDYRIIYSLDPATESDMPVRIPHTKVATIDDTPVLISVIHGYRTERYEVFVFLDSKTKAPVIIDLLEAVNNSARKYVKNKFDSFCETDINTMSCNCSLFEENAPRLGDPYYKGKLKGMIGFENGEIRLKNIKVELDN